MNHRIKFHSIYYRYILFIFLLFVIVLYLLSGGEALSIKLFNRLFIIGKEQLSYILIAICAAVTVICSLVNWKFYICKEGIYLRKSNLLVAWDEIIAVSHVWINQHDFVSGHRSFFYNRKTLVVYREKYKAICIYNISLLALYAVKLYRPKIKTNIVSASFATAVNIGLNIWILYIIGSRNILSMSFETFAVLMSLYVIKVLVLPLIMLKVENRRHGDFLYHDAINAQNSSKAIHI